MLSPFLPKPTIKAINYHSGDLLLICQLEVLKKVEMSLHAMKYLRFTKVLICQRND